LKANRFLGPWMRRDASTKEAQTLPLTSESQTTQSKTAIIASWSSAKFERPSAPGKREARFRLRERFARGAGRKP